MDPNEALQTIRRHIEQARRAHAPERGEYEYAQAAEAFDALDGWLGKGGFLPEDWSEACPAK